MEKAQNSGSSSLKNAHNRNGFEAGLEIVRSVAFKGSSAVVLCLWHFSLPEGAQPEIAPMSLLFYSRLFSGGFPLSFFQALFH